MSTNTIFSVKGSVISRHGLVRVMFTSAISLCLLNTTAAQSQKNLALADQYFQAGEYLTAASLYGQYLNPVEKENPASDFPLNFKKTRAVGSHYASRLDIVYKQAESYRLANDYKQALALYQECYAKDAVAYHEALYWAAVCNRNLGNYQAAEEALNSFLQNAPKGNAFIQPAKNEKAALALVKNELLRPDSVLYTVSKLQSPSIEKGVFAPAINGEHFIITSTQVDTLAAAGMNPHHNRLFKAVLKEGTLQNIEPLTIQSLDPSFNQVAATLSADGNTMYFTQWKKENGVQTSSIYYSKKSKTGWARPMMLSSIRKPGANTKHPFVSADGKYLFFASDRKGGMGGFDIWYATLNPEGGTGEPVNAGAAINTASNEQSPFYHVHTGSLVFSSDRHSGMGGFDLYAANGAVSSWTSVKNMGAPVNSSRDDLYFYATEGGNLLDKAFVSSDRGSDCCLATFMISKAPKKRSITGVIRDCGDNAPLADAEVIMKNNAGVAFTAITNKDGEYSFEISGDPSQYYFIVNKESYNPKESGALVQSVDESGLLEDKVMNSPVCIEKRIILKVENVVSIYFDFDKFQLKPRGTEQLDSIYSVLEKEVTATIQISGYTDGMGSVEYNEILSDRRARACAEYLLERGLDQSRISFESFGACCPVEMEAINGRDNPDGRAMNRRALIHIVKEHLSSVTLPNEY